MRKSTYTSVDIPSSMVQSLWILAHARSQSVDELVEEAIAELLEKAVEDARANAAVQPW